MIAASLPYGRLAMRRDAAPVRARSREGRLVARPQDVLKEPMVLDFLGLHQQAAWHERDLEKAILNHLESFLLELGSPNACRTLWLNPKGGGTEWVLAFEAEMSI